MDKLKKVPQHKWPHVPAGLREVWKSKKFLVQIYAASNDMERMTVCRTEQAGDRFKDGITWDDLQRLKDECGRGDFDALELYPRNRDLVNVANMRHLWIMAEPVSFGWRKDVEK